MSTVTQRETDLETSTSVTRVRALILFRTGKGSTQPCWPLSSSTLYLCLSLSLQTYTAVAFSAWDGETGRKPALGPGRPQDEALPGKEPLQKE